MVVAVLMVNCQVSLKWKNGPATAQPMMRQRAAMKAAAWPLVREAVFENRLKRREPADIVPLWAREVEGGNDEGKAATEGARLAATQRPRPSRA
jgi:hypothetical protein